MISSKYNKIVRNPTIKVDIINMLGDKVKLINNECVIDINNDNMLTLFDMIKFDTGLINIGSIIINDYVWSNTYYYYFDFPDDSNDNNIKDINKDLCDSDFYNTCKNELDIISILGKDYNKDYVTVQLILFSHIHYINHISSQHMSNLYISSDYNINELKYSNCYDHSCNIFKNFIAKLNDGRISLYEYKKIKTFLIRRLKMYNFNVDESIEILTFMLNEIQKYLIL